MNRHVNTDRQVQALKPKAKPYRVKLKDTPAGYVKVTPAGSLIYELVKRHPGGKNPVPVKVGDAQTYTITEAREAMTEMRKRIDAGLPPKELARPADSVSAIAAGFIERHVDKNSLRSAQRIKAQINDVLVPAWGARRLADIRRSDVTALLDVIEDTRGPGSADYLLATIRKMMNWHASRADDYTPVIIPGMARTKPSERARDRILSDGEIRAVWTAAGEAGTYGLIVRLAMLTGARRIKVASMKWEDVEADGVWTIATEAREKNNAGTLPLPPLAIEQIEAAPRIAENPYVFAGRERYYNGFGKGKAQLDATVAVKAADLDVEVGEWRFHDLRRTARSLMSRAGVAPNVAERVLGHKITGVEGVYDRHAYIDEKRDALVRLAGLVERIIGTAPDNVVPMKGRGDA